MRMRWKFAGILFVIAMLLWQRDGVACAMVSEYAGDGLQRELILDAESRISEVYGKTKAPHYIANSSSAMTRWLFKANPYAKTITIPGKSCVVIGPNGGKVDVLAHELVHAEIANRLGYWSYLTRLPVWFNEGAAMQVDDRPQYDLAVDTVTVKLMRQLPETSAFYAGDDALITRRYGLAKQAVALWLQRNGGNQQFYQKLEAFKAGTADLKIQ